MTLKDWAEKEYGPGRLPTLHDEYCWKAAQAAMRERAILWAVEYTLKLATRRNDWPDSWDAGFPGNKLQALLDAKDALPIE